ncbi:hypothetical protein Goshw_006608 [Gossypium schwendimanii]|uniref:Uncharacterized protein n=1 Tax=Gossypium schwendimanii TaxID=34291 RepID=A0A7J9MC14_GOSSC|nr:hypothetical protein [Gossypium schwendimanii]
MVESRILNMNLYLQFIFTVGGMGMWRILVLLKYPEVIVKRRMSRRKCHRRTRPRSSQQIEKEGSRFSVLNDKNTHKEDFEDFLLDSRCYKGKEISQGNFIGKVSATSLNGRREWRKNSNTNGNLNEVGLMENGGSTLKIINRPNSEPSKPSSSLKEIFLNLEKPVSSLGNGDLPAVDELQATQTTAWVSGWKKKTQKMSQFWRIQDMIILLFHWMLEILILVDIWRLYSIKIFTSRKITSLNPLKILILRWCYLLVRVKLLNIKVEVKLKNKLIFFIAAILASKFLEPSEPP